MKRLIYLTAGILLGILGTRNYDSLQVQQSNRQKQKISSPSLINSQPILYTKPPRIHPTEVHYSDGFNNLNIKTNKKGDITQIRYSSIDLDEIVLTEDFMRYPDIYFFSLRVLDRQR